MPQNLDLALISRVIQDQDFHSVEKAKITKDFLPTAEAREIFEYIRNVYHDPATVGRVPSYEMVHYKFPTFWMLNAPDSVPVLCQEIRRAKLALELLAVGTDLEHNSERDPYAALLNLKAKIAEFSVLTESGQDLSMAAAASQLEERYDAIANSNGVIGIPFPWQPLNDETQGMQGSQFFIIYGRPKSMKTWVAIDIATNAYLFSRRRVLFFTREMSPIQVAQRIAARIARVDYKAYYSGKLQPHIRANLFRIMRDLVNDERSAGQFTGHQPYLIVTSDKSKGSGGTGGGVTWLQAKIRELQPELVIVDGMYLMTDDRTNKRTIDWKNVAHISQDLKQTCQDFDIPLVGVTQANRGSEHGHGEDLTEMSFSDSFGQDADAILRVKKYIRVDPQTQRKTTELLLSAPGLREGTFDGIVIHGAPATDFSYIKTVSNLDEVDAEYGAQPEEKGPAKYGGRKTPPPVQTASAQMQRKAVVVSGMAPPAPNTGMTFVKPHGA